MRGRFTPDQDRGTKDLVHEMRLARDERMREQYRDIHPSEWPESHPDWGSSILHPDVWPPGGGMVRRGGRGRPVEITWSMVRDAHRALRSEGQRATQNAVADRLRCSLDTVKARSREHGGWPPR